MFKFNKTNLDLTGVVFPILTDPGRVKANINATYYIKITGDLSWNISFYGNWDNQPPPHLAGATTAPARGELDLRHGSVKKKNGENVTLA